MASRGVLRPFEKAGGEARHYAVGIAIGKAVYAS